MIDSIAERLAVPGASLDDIVRELAHEPEALADAIAGMTRAQGRVKGAMAKVVLRLSEIHPELVYHHFRAVAARLRSRSRRHQADALRLVANLAAVDRTNQVEHVLDDYLRLTRSHDGATVNKAVSGALRIARARPELAQQIVSGLLAVEAARYPTDDDRYQAINKVLAALAQHAAMVAGRDDVLQFARRQVRDPRRATEKQATMLLREMARVKA